MPANQPDAWTRVGYSREDAVAALRRLEHPRAEEHAAEIEAGLRDGLEAGTLGINEEFYLMLAFGSPSAFATSAEMLRCDPDSLRRQMDEFRASYSADEVSD